MRCAWTLLRAGRHRGKGRPHAEIMLGTHRRNLFTSRFENTPAVEFYYLQRFNRERWHQTSLCPHENLASSLHPPQGCVVIFVSYFLALLIKVDAATEGHRTAVAFFLVAINAVLVVAFITTSWFAVKESVDDLKDAEATLT